MSVSFRIILGVNPGYRHKNVVAKAAEDVAQAWQTAMENEFHRSKLFISAAVTDGLLVYSFQHGCPLGGEVVAIIQGDSNPMYHQDDGCYRDAVMAIARVMKSQFRQSRLQVTFTSDCEAHYLEDA